MKKTFLFFVLFALIQFLFYCRQVESSKFPLSTQPEPIPAPTEWFIVAVYIVVIVVIVASIVTPGFILYKKGKASVTPQFLNKTEVMLGASVLLLSILSILSVFFSVVPSPGYPGHYTHSAFADFSSFSLILVSFLGISAIWYGAYRHDFLELALGIIVCVWGFWSSAGVGLEIGEAHRSFIRGSLTNHLNGILLLLTPNVILGIALMLNGLRKRKT